uniref:Uncharacterized protein n=1 Tax=Strongyloides venezuelensis TaxID=75913 RepID=A0A0K0FNE8_STRVS
MIIAFIFLLVNFTYITFTCCKDNKDEKVNNSPKVSGVPFKGKHLSQPQSFADKEMNKSILREGKNSSNRNVKSTRSNGKRTSANSNPRNRNKSLDKNLKEESNMNVQHPLTIVERVKDPKIIYIPKVEIPVLPNQEKAAKDSEKQAENNIKEN